jgi:FixJ family two-component response regulator
MALMSGMQETEVPGKPLISIVDDDQLMRDSMRQLVKSFGFAVATFPSAMAFLESPDRDETSCLIADVQMPGMTGDELYRRLIGDGRAIPTILVTAYPNDRVRSRALSDGVVCYIHKPFDQSNLMSCVRRALESGSPASSSRQSRE